MCICDKLIKDLGILFDTKLLFNTQILAIKNETLSDFQRNCSEFHDLLTLKCICTSLIR